MTRRKPTVSQLHEVADRASLLCDVWHRHLVDIDAVKLTPRLRNMSRDIGDAMADFYQLAANAHVRSG